MAFLTRQKFAWVKLADNLGITDSARDCAQVFEYRGRLWMNDGYKPGNINTDDLLASSDGVKWQVVTAPLPCDKYTPAGVHKVGDVEYMFFVDQQVRRTSDGVSFTTIPANNPPPYTPEGALVSLNGKMHIVGRTHCYSSVDGSDWVHTPVPWPMRAARATCLFNGRVYVMAGAADVMNAPPEVGYPAFTTMNEVWSTHDPEDPGAWVNHGKAPWRPRMWPGLAVHDGALYLFGGYDNTAPGSNNWSDTWRMDVDGKWERLELVSEIPNGRHAPALYSRNGRLMLACGNSNRGTNIQPDVWELRLV